jgi:hypothetical protein
MNKKTWIAVLAVLLVAVLAVGMLLLYHYTRPEGVTGDKKITVKVVHKDKTEKVFTYETNEEYLGPVLSGAGLLQGDEGPYGLMIHTVDGEKADWNVDQSYWAVYQGEEYATVGIDQMVIRDGDTFSLVYTIG